MLFSLWGGDCAAVFTVGWGLCCCVHCGVGIVLLFSLWGGDCAVFTVGWGLCCFDCGVGIVLMFSLWGGDWADLKVKKNTYFNQTIQNMGKFSVKISQATSRHLIHY